MPAKFKKTTLASGIRVLSENHPDSRCVVTGIWAGTGARHESPKQVGISHLLEHMVFKGTEKYNALELALALESRGGDINAFTAREHTCYHTTSLKEDLALSVEVLSQLVAFANFKEEDLVKEKRVVQQEILMAADDLEEYVYDLYFERIFQGNSLGYQILGTTESIENTTLEDIRTYYNWNYRPQNLIVTAAGCVDHEELVQFVEKSFQAKKWAGDFQAPKLITPARSTVREHFLKDCEQYHVVVGFPACKYPDEDRLNGFVVNTALGGGMTSKLYQKIREDRGLVYSIFSMLNTFMDTGIQTIYAGTEKAYVQEVLGLIKEELVQLKSNGLSHAEIELYKTQAKGQIIIGAEDIDNRMNSIAVNEMVFGEYRSVEKVIADIEKVSEETVMNYINDKLDPENLSLFTFGSEKVTDSI